MQKFLASKRSYQTIEPVFVHKVTFELEKEHESTPRFFFEPYKEHFVGKSSVQYRMFTGRL